MKIGNYLIKCGEFSLDFQERESGWYLDDEAGRKIEKISNKGISYSLATYLFDMSFEVDEGSWEFLEKIAEVFNSDIAYRTLKNMFCRNHDT